MPDEVPPPPAPPLPPTLRPPRPPPPGPVVWLAFLFGPSPVLALGCVVVDLASRRRWPNPDELLAVIIGGAVVGIPVAACLVGGLALATRFYSGLGARILGGLLLGVTLLVGITAVVFAGCMCLLSHPNYR